MSGTGVKETCKQIIDESTAIIAYTDSIDAVDDELLRSICAEIRRDELGHLQKLIVALTEILSNSEPAEAEQMDNSVNVEENSTGGDDK